MPVDAGGGALIIEPIKFISLDALKAGWYLLWRQFVRFFAVMLVAGVLGGVLMAVGGDLGKGLGGVVIGLGALAGAIWYCLLVPRFTRQWAREKYGQELTGGDIGIWWGVVWRTWVFALVAAVILAPVTVFATSMKVWLGLIGTLMLGVIQLVNILVTVLATGWAMSRVVEARLTGLLLEPVAAANAFSPLGAVEPASETAPVAAPRPAAAAVAAAAQPAVVSSQGKRQCPKCSLFETEKGSVIGWYCKICGWREGR